MGEVSLQDVESPSVEDGHSNDSTSEDGILKACRNEPNDQNDTPSKDSDSDSNSIGVTDNLLGQPTHKPQHPNGYGHGPVHIGQSACAHAALPSRLQRLSSWEARAPDGGWGWMIVLGCAGINFILGGMCKAFGIIYLQLLDTYGASASATSWVGSLGNSNSFLLSPFASVLINRFSVRPVVMMGGLLLCCGFLVSAFASHLPVIYLGYGFIYGLGSALCLCPSYVIVSQYFHTRKGLATGLASAGSGVGSFVLPFMIDFLVKHYAYTGTMIILAGIFLNACVCGALYRPLRYNIEPMNTRQSSEDSDLDRLRSGHTSMATSVTDLDGLDHFDPDLEVIPEHSNGDVESLKLDNNKPSVMKNIKDKCVPECKLLDLSLLKEPVFLIFGFSNLFAMLALGPALIYLPALAREKGITEGQRALMVAIIGASDGIGRILVGFLFDIKCIRRHRTRYYNGNILLTGVLYCLCIFIKDFTGFVPLCAIIGISSGTVLAQRAVIATDLLGIDRLPSTLGLSSLFFGIGGVLGSPIAGGLTDYFGSYKAAYIFATICACISSMILALDVLRTRWRHNRWVNSKHDGVYDLDPDIYRCSSINNIALES